MTYMLMVHAYTYLTLHHPVFDFSMTSTVTPTGSDSSSSCDAV